MTALVKQNSKGIVLLQSVSSVYTALASLTEVEVTGRKNEVNETTTLDGGAYKTKQATGYVDPPTIKFTGFYDPVHATYTNLDTIIGTPPAGGTNFKITYPDAAPTSQIWNVVGAGYDVKAEAPKQIMANGELVTSGPPS